MAASILVVEDESIVALDIKKTLIKLGYEVCAISSSGELAIEKCQEFSPDLVLMDIRLKGSMDGIAAASEIKNRFSIPVVYLTAHADEKTLERAKITEPFGYILKPFEPVELRVALELALYKKFGDSNREQKNKTSVQQVHLQEPTFEDQENISPSKQSQLIKKFQGFSAFSVVSEDSIKMLLKDSFCRQLKSGELLVFEGDSRDFGFFVLSGRVSLFKSSFSGKELIVELLKPADLFGLALAIENQPYTFSARTQVDSEVLFVPQRSIAGLFSREPELYRQFLSLISNRLTRSHDMSRALAHDRAEVRISASLLAVVPEDGESDIAKVYITRKELAELSGTTVETAIRVTKAMERDRLLDLSQNGCVRVPDLTRFRKYVEESTL